MADGGRDAGVPFAEAIAWSPVAVTPGPGASNRLRAQIFLRDHFVCRYCGTPTIHTGVVRLLAVIYPDQIPFENDHWPAARTHPAFPSITASLDHVEPRSLGGHPTDPDNLVTTCSPCN